MLASSPKLFAGSCALHRLLTPRHPPYALSYLLNTTSIIEANVRQLALRAHRPLARSARAGARWRTSALEHTTQRSSVDHHSYADCERDPVVTQNRASEVPLGPPGPGRTGRSKPGSSFRRSPACSHHRGDRVWLHKGGDPAAGSPTATLLRLHPNHRPDRWRLPPLRVG